MKSNNTTMIPWDKKTFIINELTQAKEQLKQLDMLPYPSATTCGKLSITKILSSLENSISVLNGIESEGSHDQPQMTVAPPLTRTESPPRSVTGSPRSDYDSDLKADKKTLPRWTEKVRVCEQMGLEVPLDDGYSWRKYGQKEILNANHPRGYYRCTHRNVQGCLAMKQVQRTDEDPSAFNVTYRGRHTCIQASHLMPGQPHKKYDNKQNKSKETLANFQTSCHVKPEDFTAQALPGTSSFSFPSTSTPTPCLEKESDNSNFSALTPDNHFIGSLFSSSKPIPCLEKESDNNSFSSLIPDNHFIGSLFSSSFISPTVSESNYLSTYGQSLQTLEYDVNELISAATLDMCSPFQDLDLDIPIQSSSNYQFDIPSFFG
ncbi:hypothetical protein MKW94_029163 [Papaver nudicaule]|uniref:WRKY domain-containing protein n=1 Tax=Papaver nudicaule TaxID=74823 RepID=A0AA41S629_PAPNU|nr:hypothetical protein [Papaver nudicaule]